MADKKMDATSDAVRSNPDTADEAREAVSQEAEEGLRKAAEGTRFREDVDTSKTPEQERKMSRSDQGVPGAITK
jgi:hypothetical protein